MLEQEKPIFTYMAPKNQFIGVLSIPHSGEEIPVDIAPFLVNDFKHLAQDVDWRVHELVDLEKLTQDGIGVIYSHIIRTAVDLNRSRDLALLNWKKNSKGISIVKEEPDQKLGEVFLGKYYDPYYEMMRTMMEELKNHTKVPNFIDLHSMPSKAEKYHLEKNPNQKIDRPDFCLSDQHGKTCEKNFIDFMQNQLGQYFSEVTQNDPYVGGHVTQYIGKHYPEGNNIQIEISRAVYMNEETKELKTTQVDYLKSHLTDSIIKCFQEFNRS